MYSYQSSFIRNCLDAHNTVRALHGVSPLSWSSEIAVKAQKWANHLAAIDQLQHDSTTSDGENLFYMYGGDPEQACDRAVKNWYQELKNYDFKSPHLEDSTSECLTNRFHLAVRVYSDNAWRRPNVVRTNKWRDWCLYHVLTSTVHYQSTHVLTNEFIYFTNCLFFSSTFFDSTRHSSIYTLIADTSTPIRTGGFQSIAENPGYFTSNAQPFGIVPRCIRTPTAAI